MLESADNANAWDGGHRRPRSLSRVGDWWYLYFEGAAEDERETTQTSAMAFNEALRNRSLDAQLIMTNLPLPKYTDGTAEYMEHLELLTEDCPRVLLIAGQRDAEVPWELALRLADTLRSDDVQVTLVKGGDHRLSLDADIRLLLSATEDVLIACSSPSSC